MHNCAINCVNLLYKFKNMSRKRILIDMDHVMADITSQFIVWYQRNTGVEMNREDLMGKPEDLAFPEPRLIREFLHTPGFFATAPVIPGSQSVIRELNQLYDVLYCFGSYGISTISV